MLGCSMSRSSMGLASAVAPSAVKQGGGVTNQLSSMQPLSEPALLLPPPPPPHSRPEPGEADSADPSARLDRGPGAEAPETQGRDLVHGPSGVTSSRARPLCVLRRLRGGRGHSVFASVICMLS